MAGSRLMQQTAGTLTPTAAGRFSTVRGMRAIRRDAGRPIN